MTIELNNLNYRYKYSKDNFAIQDVNAIITPGIHLLIGENGAGKTTLLHLIAGLLTPTTGKCMIDGAETCHRLPSIQSKMFLSGVNIDFPMRSIKEMEAVHAPFYPNFDAKLLHDNLATFGIDAATPLAQLSTGNAQKAKIAYALALRTPVLLLDEPANGIDIESKQLMRKMIAASVSTDQTVIISTHSVRDLENFYDGVIDLYNGKLQYALSINHIHAKLDFGIADSIPENAIYAEPWVGSFRFVLAKAGREWTDIDFEMLYMATRKANDKLLKNLKS